MGVATDIARTYRAPRAVIRHRIGMGEREGAALATLMLACVLIFVSQWPRLSRQAFETGQELDMLIGGTLLSWLFMMPLIFYVLAFLAELVLRIGGPEPSGFSVRMATFWSLLAATPLWLLWGLTAGFVGSGAAANVTGAAALASFVIFWISGLRETRALASSSAPKGDSSHV